LPETADIGSKADLWVAHWGARVPASVNGWQRWTFWQLTNKASILGIPGAADMDEDRFNGSIGELQVYSAEFARIRRESAASVTTELAATTKACR